MQDESDNNVSTPSKVCLCWVETIKVSLIIGLFSSLLVELVINDIIMIYTPLIFHLYVFIGSTIIAIVAFRLGWLNKGCNSENCEKP